MPLWKCDVWDQSLDWWQSSSLAAIFIPVSIDNVRMEGKKPAALMPDDEEWRKKAQRKSIHLAFSLLHLSLSLSRTLSHNRGLNSSRTIFCDTSHRSLAPSCLSLSLSLFHYPPEKSRPNMSAACSLALNHWLFLRSCNYERSNKKVGLMSQAKQTRMNADALIG